MKKDGRRMAVRGMNWTLAAAVFLSAAALPVYAEETEYEKAVTLIADYVLPLDEAGVLFEEEMAEIGDCLDGEGELASLRTSLLDMAGKIETIAQELTEYVSPDDAEEIMEACGIDKADYEAVQVYLIDDIYSLADELSYFYQMYFYDYTDEEVEAYLEEFRENLEFEEKCWEAKKGYCYYLYINYFFAEWDEEELKVVEEKLLSELSVLDGDDFEWKNQRDDTEAMIEEYLDQYEEYNQQYAEFTAGLKEGLIRKQG